MMARRGGQQEDEVEGVAAAKDVANPVVELGCRTTDATAALHAPTPALQVWQVTVWRLK